MKNRAPEEDGITSEIYNHAFKTEPTFITAIYNSCLKQGYSLQNGRRPS